MRAILPALEADAALYRNYVYTEGEPFAFPIRAYGGADDPNVQRGTPGGMGRTDHRRLSPCASSPAATST